MTWTPATPPSAAWAKDTTTPSSWSADAPPFAAWDIESTTGIRRITQDGRLRVTEQNVIRIIERPTFKWTISLKSPDPWHLS